MHLPSTSTGPQRRTFILIALLTLLTAGMFLVGGRVPTAHAATGDFSLSYTDVNGSSPSVVYLVRGGLTSCNPATNCNGGLVEPKVKTLYGYYPNYSYGWDLSFLTISAGDPDSGFRGTVTFAVSSLPAGVTSQTAPSTTITDNTILYYDYGFPVYGTTTTLQLTASATAALGTSTLTVSASSGSLVHTTTLQIDVVSQLPPLALRDFNVSQTTVTGGQTDQGTVTLNYPVPTGQTYVIALSSSNPRVASLPSSVSIPAGSRSATFTITTYHVSKVTLVTFPASYNGQTVDGSIQVNP